MAANALMKQNSTRGLTVRRVRARHDGAFNAFLNELDPRGDSKRSEAVRFALACSDGRFSEFLNCLARPRYKRHSLAAIARTCDISFQEFVAFWQKAQSERARDIAIYAMPAIVENLAADACSRDITCERCDGFGSVYVEDELPAEFIPGYLGRVSDQPDAHQIRACPACMGSGSIRKLGDKHAIDKILELTGMIGKRGAVQINQNFGGMGMDAASERLSAITFNVDAEEVIDEAQQRPRRSSRREEGTPIRLTPL